MTKVNISYWLTVASYLALLLLLLGQTYSHVPDDAQWWQGLFIWGFKIIPLLLITRGLIQQRHTSATWLSFLSMLYLIFGVLLAFTRGGEFYGWLMTLDSLVLFMASMMYTRWKKEQDATTKLN